MNKQTLNMDAIKARMEVLTDADEALIKEVAKRAMERGFPKGTPEEEIEAWFVDACGGDEVLAFVAGTAAMLTITVINKLGAVLERDLAAALN